MSNKFLDCETLPTDNAVIKQYILDNMKAPGQMKKPETIQAWLDDPANLKTALHKTGLSGLFGTLACIGIADDVGDVKIIEGNERDVLGDFLNYVRTPLSGGGYTQSKLIGHNIMGFDAPFISQRMLVHGFGPLFPFNSKPWDCDMADTMSMFQAHNKDFIKLVNLCMALGVDKPLDEIDGSQVALAWEAGEYQLVFDHCTSDVIATRGCYQAMVPAAAEQKEAA